MSVHSPTTRVQALLLQLQRQGCCDLIAFDSSQDPHQPTCSFVSCQARDHLQIHHDGHAENAGEEPIADPLAWMRARIEPSTDTTPIKQILTEAQRPRLAGMLSFELAWMLDALPTHSEPGYGSSPRPGRALPLRSPGCPLAWIGDYPAFAILDHHNGQWSLRGDPGSQAYLALQQGLREAVRLPGTLEELLASCPRASIEAPSWEIDAARYQADVQACREAIEAGELFEINYSARLRARTAGLDPLAMYLALCAVASGGYFGYLDMGALQLMSASPEQFLELRDGWLTARPIKGTLRRSEDPREDQALAEQLRSSEKDRAENIMIVDLMRNDLTRVCRTGSVQASQLCAVESFAGLHHLVSTVRGQLADGVDALSAMFPICPGGSITGAPKLRSIELIAALEASARGPYTGNLFYCSADGSRLDASILIRSAWLHQQMLRYGAGGAVVFDSDPGAEWREAELKARPFTAAIALLQELA